MVRLVLVRVGEGGVAAQGPGKASRRIYNERDRCESDPVIGVKIDRRYFLHVILGGQPYRALIDPEATISVVGPKLARRFRETREYADSALEAATSQMSQILGRLKIKLDLDGSVNDLAT